MDLTGPVITVLEGGGWDDPGADAPHFEVKVNSQLVLWGRARSCIARTVHGSPVALPN